MLWIAVPAIGAPAVRFGGVGEYGRRHFYRDGWQFSANYWSSTLKPSIRLSPAWAMFFRVGYSLLVFDRPAFQGRDYESSGWEWGGGLSWNPWRRPPFYAGAETWISRLNTSRRGGEKGDLTRWETSARAGVDLGEVDAYLGGAYTGGRITHRWSRDQQREREDYNLRENFTTFVGIGGMLPGLGRADGRLYLGRDTMVTVGLGVTF